MSIRNKIGICYRILLGAAVLATGAGLVLYTSESIETAGKAAAMCIEVILPSLFPFLVVSNLVIGLGFAEAAGRVAAPIMRRVFNLNGACASAFLMGIVGGYPVGARAAITSYERGLCTKTECERMLSFCNNSGPAFILGVVGAGVFANSRAGMLLYLAHVLASLTVGVCFRFYKRREPILRTRAGTYEKRKPSRVFVEAVRSGLAGIGNISAFVIFFAVAINLLFASGALGALAHAIARLLTPFGVDSGSVERLLVGAIEMTSGLTSLKGAAESMNARLSMAAFLLGWAGVSVHCQVLSFLGDSGLSLMPYLSGKLMHAVLSAVYMAALSRIVPLAANTAVIAAGQVEILTQMNLIAYLACALINCAAVLFTLFLLWIWDKLAGRV
ncbi:MAG: sporulation protein [Clostridiaceae bacterium]|nr:sporulation protein [Clostridiaceae bacterium]